MTAEHWTSGGPPGRSVYTSTLGPDGIVTTMERGLGEPGWSLWSRETLNLNTGEYVWCREVRGPSYADNQYRRATLPITFRPAAPPDPTIDSVELTQAIQELQSLSELKADLAVDREPPVPIVAGKPAVLRVYGSRPAANVTTVTIDVTSAQVALTPSSRRLDLQVLCTREYQRLKHQPFRCDSADFYFIPPAGNFDITVRMRGPNGVVTDEHTLPFKARTTNTLSLRAVSVCSRWDAGKAEDCGPTADLLNKVELLRKLAPTSSVTVEVTNDQIVEDSSRYTNEEELKWWGAVAREVGKKPVSAPPGVTAKGWGVVLFPVLEGEVFGYSPTRSRGGAGQIAPIDLYADVGAETLAHEVFHLLGLEHTNRGTPVAVNGKPPGCSALAGVYGPARWPWPNNKIQSNARIEVGLDLLPLMSAAGLAIGGAPVNGDVTYDIMSYCLPLWISPLNYKQLITELSGGSVSLPLRRDVETGPGWLLSGSIVDGAAHFDPLFAIEAPLQSGTGSHVVQVLDSDGNVLATGAFTPVIAETRTLSPNPERGFSIVVPKPAGAARLIIRSDTNETIGTLLLGGTAPAVQLVAPVAPGTLIGDMPLTWAITDPDSSSHTTRVQYSHDNGLTWADLGAVNTNHRVVGFDKLPGGTATLIRLVTSDGINSGTSTFGPFTTPKKRTVTAKILSPAADVVVAPGMLFFDGFGLDIDDGSLTGAALAWRSDVAGPLGTGEQIGVNLPSGRHVIELRATDSDGNTAATTVNVVVAGPAPQIALRTQTLTLPPTTCVVATISVSASGLPAAGVEVSLNAGLTWSEVPLGALPYRFLVPGSGAVNLIARAFDAAGQATVAGQQFSASGNCTAVTPAAWSAPAGQSAQTMSVTSAAANLAWTAFTDQPWLTVSPTSGVGSGNATLTAAATTSVAPRTATAWIAGQAVTVTQAGGTPSFTVTPASWSTSNAGGAQTISVRSTLTDAPWTASTSEPWLGVSAAGGTGNGGVTLTAAPNPGGTTRAAIVTIAGHALTVWQGDPVPFDLRVTNVVGNVVTFRWSWGGPPPSGFVVAGGTRPGETLATLPTGSPSPIVTFTAPSGSFFVRVYSADDTALARPSNEVPLIVNVPVAPSAPANLLGSVSSNRVDLAWTNTFGGAPPTGVTLQVSGALTAAAPLGLTERAGFSGVPGGTYTVAVVATNAGGASVPSEPLTITIPVTCTGPPEPPSHFLVYRVGRTAFAVWEPADTGPAPTEFDLRVAELGLNLPTGGARTLSGNVPPGEYTISVSARNSCGASAFTPAQTLAVP